MSRYEFILTSEDKEYEDLPTNCVVSHSFDGDCTILVILEAFKDFLRGCTFSDQLVDRIQYMEIK